jgi:iron complex outermembrane receptor protein
LDPNNFRVDREIVKIFTEMNWDLGFGELIFLPAITRMEQDLLSGMLFFPMGPAPPGTEPTEGFTHALGSQNEVSFELRLTSPEDSFMKWIAGAYYYNRRYQYLSIEEDHSNERWYENPSKAIFANATYPISDRFRANFGGRYTQDLQQSHVIDRWFPGFTPPPMGGPAGFDTDVKFFDYKLGIEYDISDNSMLWLDYSTGSRAGMRGWPDETLDAYQVGSKNRFLDDRLQLNLSTYYYSYENYEVRAPSLEYTYENPPGSGEYTTISDRGSGSGGEATIIGAELAMSYLATPNDRFDLNVAYQNGEVSALTFIYDYNPPMDFAGGKLNNSPEFTIFGSYQHEFLLSSGGTVTARAEARYQTESFVMMNAIYNPDMLRNVPPGMDVAGINTNPAHAVTNASVRYSAPGGKWSLNAYIKNIEDYAEKKNLLNNALRIGPPRTFGIVWSFLY